MTLRPVLTYRWIVFLLAAGYCLRTLIYSDFSSLGGPFRFLTIWALFASFFSASRMVALMEKRSHRRWDGFVCMTAVINVMVVFLFWRLYFADPMSVTANGSLNAWHLELYLHLVGPMLQVFDTVFIHCSYTRLRAASLWLIGTIGTYVVWIEFLVRPVNDVPRGTVTAGLPYPFLNDLEWSNRVIFYGVQFTTALVILFALAFVARLVRRRALVQVAP